MRRTQEGFNFLAAAEVQAVKSYTITRRAPIPPKIFARPHIESNPSTCPRYERVLKRAALSGIAAGQRLQAAHS